MSDNNLKDPKFFFSTKINNLMEIKGITQDDIARELNVNVSNVNDWCDGKCYPEIETLIQLAVLLNRSVDYLVRTDLNIASNAICEEIGLTDESIDKLIKLNNNPTYSQNIIMKTLNTLIENIYENDYDLIFPLSLYLDPNNDMTISDVFVSELQETIIGIKDNLVR